jgi:hypothetical protein
MSTSRLESSGHLISRFSSRLHAVLDGLLEVPAWSMTAEEQRRALVELARAEARIAGLRLRVLAAADGADVAAESAATSTAAWVAHETRQVRASAHADLRLAKHLDGSCAATREALAGGRLDREQAEVIVRAVDRLPKSVGAADRERAEKHLVDLAGEHDAKALKLLGRRVFEVIDPVAADLEDDRRLAAEEAAAERKTYFHLRDNGDGTHTGRFKIPTLHAAMLTKMLHALAAPRRAAHDGAHDTAHEGASAGARDSAQDGAHDNAAEAASAGARNSAQDGAQDGAPPSATTRPERMGQAFCQLLERFPGSRLPKSGGVSATVVVLLDFDKLLTGLGTATLDTGQRISAGLARRLACEAGVIPAVYRTVLGGPSVVLDLGRRRRFHDEYQRIAMTIRDGGCTAEGCDRPASWCHAHHDQVSWSEGGGTSLTRGRFLCPFHQGKAHSPHYEMTRLPTGSVRFHRRT